EVLEAALIITIILAATRGVHYRGLWVSAGVVTGILGAILVAYFADVISALMEGMGQEIFNASVLLAAVLMLAWHNIWIAAHGRELAQQMKAVGQGVSEDKLPMAALASAIALAVLREGAEIVLFLNGIAMSGEAATGLIGGSLLGLAGGTMIGAAMYSGMLRIPLRHFFRITGWMILLLAAGLAASAAGFLEQAGILPAITPAMWDSSWLLDEHSVIGQLAHTLTGYQSRPSGIALAAWITTFSLVLLLMKTASPASPNQTG
ncbi:MAG: high-affinity iron transporter, partial [Pseudomonadota bacterium]|nr:high-affinity iron transporter [Pseudomonadota bacterium]